MSGAALLRAGILCIGLALLPAAGGAQSVVADLSQNAVSITADFQGSEILVFGAIETDAPVEVIVAVSGPATPVTVRKKSRVAGIWINTEGVEIDAAPSIYKIATTAPLSQILSEVEDLRHRISIPRAIRSVGAPDTVLDASRFTEALIRLRSSQGLYRVQEGAVTVRDGALFRTTISLPANLVEGLYTARVFLTRDRTVVARYSTALDVRKVGLERWIYTLAHVRPMLYGLMSLAIAIAAGWAASAFFRYIRG